MNERTTKPITDAAPVEPPQLFWHMMRSAFIDYFRVFHGMRYRYERLIPMRGCVIFAPNHGSYYDPPLIGSGPPWQLRFMAWDALFRVPILAQWMRAFGAFPVKLQSADRTAVETTLNVLREGGSLVIFPEGQRTFDGKLGPLEKGMARMALSVGATVVPVAITGAYQAYNRHHIFPRFGWRGSRRITVKYYPAIELRKIENIREMRDAVAELNAKVATILERRLRAYERLLRR